MPTDLIKVKNYDDFTTQEMEECVLIIETIVYT